MNTLKKILAGEAIRHLVWDSIDSRLSFIGLIQPMPVLTERKGRKRMEIETMSPRARQKHDSRKRRNARCCHSGSKLQRCEDKRVNLKFSAVCVGIVGAVGNVERKYSLETGQAISPPRHQRAGANPYLVRIVVYSGIQSKAKSQGNNSSIPAQDIPRRFTICTEIITYGSEGIFPVNLMWHCSGIRPVVAQVKKECGG